MNQPGIPNPEQPKLLEGGVAVDDRGAVRFVNGFDFQGVKRFYCVKNHRVGTVRAWHAHKNEAKYVTVLTGAAIIGAVQIDDWNNPSPTNYVNRFVLSAENPAVLFIPTGYANGFKSLTEDTLVVYFSTATIDESKDDDWRYPAHYWDIWDVVER